VSKRRPALAAANIGRSICAIAPAALRHFVSAEPDVRKV
jgi:hypothetical protein